ncbi:hypothetical protein ACFL27_24040 [candidate division CSSED10-310 bacterium]|uniref:ATP-grasp domain-containing protein n=1 Tax=candidate division CSSED10-310 bacterium TaxID=2855610 RepID=A0ABV6Z4B4_UNCC1
MKKEDLRLLDGGLEHEMEIPCYDDSPTWIVDEAWDKVKEVCERSLDAYMDYCHQNKLPHSFLLGLDVLITAELDPDNPNRIVDVRPTMMEGPCCNSYPACPNIDSYRLYRRALLKGKQPDMVEYPTHPTAIAQTIVDTFVQIHHSRGGQGMPRVGIFTRPYPESEEETAHRLIHSALLMNNIKAYRITPEEKPQVKDGKIWVSGVPIDLCYRRIERIHVPEFYGQELATRIINETPETLWFNPWIIDDLRSKTLEERVFRAWEAKTGQTISRGKTLLGEEITPEGVRDLANRGGFVIKKWNSTGGRGVFLHVNQAAGENAFNFLYDRYDGRHMALLDADQLEQSLLQFKHYNEDASLQQLRLIDTRDLADGKLVYDTRINVIYQPLAKKWLFLSGISRVVKCGQNVQRGNSLLTNITSGAEIAPLIIGYLKEPAFKNEIDFGHLLNSMLHQEEYLDTTV